MLASVAEELPDTPLYYNLHDVCKTVHCTPPPMDILRSAIANAGDLLCAWLRSFTSVCCHLHVKHTPTWRTPCKPHTLLRLI